MTTEEDFQRKLNTDPEDLQTRLVFADWLDERGDDRGVGYRALGMLGYLMWYTTYIEEWLWYAPVSYRDDDYSCLPEDWFNELKKGRHHVSGKYREYNTRREGEDDAARAFSKLPASRREELLKVPVL